METPGVGAVAGCLGEATVGKDPCELAREGCELVEAKTAEVVNEIGGGILNDVFSANEYVRNVVLQWEYTMAMSAGQCPTGADETTSSDPEPQSGGTTTMASECGAQENTGWVITSHTPDAECNIVNHYGMGHHISCFHSAVAGGQYKDNQQCKFEYVGNAIMTRSSWDIEQHEECGFDFLQVNGNKKYCGNTASSEAFPSDLIVTGTTQFIFQTDSSVTHDGFTLCAIPHQDKKCIGADMRLKARNEAVQITVPELITEAPVVPLVGAVAFTGVSIAAMMVLAVIIRKKKSKAAAQDALVVTPSADSLAML
jgi:hypothetical protein